MLCAGVTPASVTGVQEGSRGLSWAEIITLHSAGVTQEFVRAVREPARPAEGPGDESSRELPPIEYSADDMVMLSFRGVSAEYIIALRAAGYRLTAGEIADLTFRGVSASFAADVKEAGYDLSGPELSNLVFRGVDAEFRAQLWEAGYRFTPGELADLKFRGVTARYAAALAEPGYEPLAAKEIIKLHFRGVDPELVKALRPETEAEE